MKKITKILIGATAAVLIGGGIYVACDFPNVKNFFTGNKQESQKPDKPGQDIPLSFIVELSINDIVTTQEVAVGEKVIFPEEEPTKDGFVFLGYAIKGTEGLIDTETFTPTTNVTLIAVFEEIQTADPSLFSFSGETITGYTGGKTHFALPKSYSLNSEGQPVHGTDINVTAVAQDVFLNNTDIKAVVIPNEIKTFGKNCFKGCTSLSYVKISDNATALPEGVFRGCTNLKSITLPEKLTSLCLYAFSNSGIESISLPNGIKSISNYTFRGCTNLKSITLPTSLTSIAMYSFYECTSLVDVVIPASLTTLSDYAFQGCTALKNVEILGNISAINNYTFKGCTALESVNIPDSVTSIGTSAFEGCKSLKSIHIPASVTSIKTGVNMFAFDGCSSLSKITVADENPNFTDDDNNILIGLENKMLMKVGVDTIDISLPTGFDTVMTEAFEGCTKLRSVVFSEGITILDDVFRDIITLESVILPETLTTLKARVFSGTGISTLIIPASVTSIGSGCFSNMPKLKYIVFEGATPATLSSSSLVTESSDVSLYVPDEAVDTYKTAENWSYAKLKAMIKPVSELTTTEEA